MKHGKIFIIQVATIMACWYGLDAYLYATDGFNDNPAFGVLMAAAFVFTPHLVWGRS